MHTDFALITVLDTSLSAAATPPSPSSLPIFLHLLLLLPDRLIVPRCRSAHAICSLSRESMARGTRPAGSGQGTLRASLSDTFLQTLPDLVTPLKGHSLSPRSCPPTRKTTNESAKYETIEAFFAPLRMSR